MNEKAQPVIPDGIELALAGHRFKKATTRDGPQAPIQLHREYLEIIPLLAAMSSNDLIG